MASSAVGALSTKFLFVKIDGEREPDLMRTCRASGFPHTAFIDKNKKALGSISGFVTASVFVEEALKAFKAAGPTIASRDMQKLEALFGKGKDAFAKDDYRTAIESLRSVADVNVELDLVKQAKEMLTRIEVRGAQELTAAQQLASEQKYKEALAQLREISYRYAGSSVEKQASDAASALLAHSRGRSAPEGGSSPGAAHQG